MCGIFGIKIPVNTPLRSRDWERLVERLFRLSETRGKEASGIAARLDGELLACRHPLPANDFLRTGKYKTVIERARRAKGDLVIIGHTRLATHGERSAIVNNQPVVRAGMVIVHNGIVCNHQNLWCRETKEIKVGALDTEVIPLFVSRRRAEGAGIEEAFRLFYKSLEGDASVAALYEDQPILSLSTNTGSIYLAEGRAGELVFASELGILNRLFKHGPFAQQFGEIQRMSPGDIRLVTLDQIRQATIRDMDAAHRDRSASVANILRCTRCILPKTFPGIRFDAEGVCSVCNSYQVFTPTGKEALKALCDKHRRSDGKPDCIIALSGGRDSSYALHVLKKEMNMNPVAFTYDWGMVTDLARRNIARMCGKLGVEHILVSADIPQKRKFISLNVDAWIKDPKLGMVSLFMAGDKQFFYHYRRIQEDMNIGLTFFASNRLEQSGFKTGFCGARETNSWYLYVPKLEKFRMVLYFIKNFLINPFYLNRSLPDTAFSFYCAYALKHDFEVFYDYIPWDENEIMSTLKRDYDWEMAGDTDSSWRIGDGTAAFYNYIYYSLAGFTEHDTFLSNQIRSGMISREQALRDAAESNKPRFEAIREYARLIGVDYGRLVQAVESETALYEQPLEGEAV
jgi:glucosamine--fructose-6-phosphate aminotransferase (isomerizing)